MRIILRIGGSVIANPVNSKLIKEYVRILKKLRKDGHEVVAVVGGGNLAREFINIAKDLKLTESDQDEVAISVSRLFAQLFIEKLGKLACDSAPVMLEKVAKCLEEKKIVVMGGLKPGMTTDTVAALVAGQVGADLLVKATDQEGIFDKDPRKQADAVKLDHLTFADLSGVFAENKHKAGIHQIIDPEAVKILRHSRTKIIVVSGFNPRNVVAAVEGRPVGTVIE